MFESGRLGRNTDCDYSSAYISIFTDGASPLVGHGMTFTIGRGNEIVSWIACFVRGSPSCDSQVCQAIAVLASKLIDCDPEDLFKSMGKTWEWLSSDSQLRWWAFTIWKI